MKEVLNEHPEAERRRKFWERCKTGLVSLNDARDFQGDEPPTGGGYLAINPTDPESVKEIFESKKRKK